MGGEIMNKRVNTVLSDEQDQYLNKLSKDTRISKSTLISLAVQDYIVKHENSKTMDVVQHRNV